MKYFWLFIAILILIGAGSVAVIHRQNRLERLREESKKPPEEIKITFIEGWTLGQFGEAISKKFAISKTDFLNDLNNFDTSSYAIVSQRPKGVDLEGYLFPDTYFFFKEANSEAIIDKLLQNFENKFKQAALDSRKVGDRYAIPGYEDLTIDGAKGLTVNEVITLASIVERETGRDTTDQAKLSEERKIVAGIFYNRLLIGKALESDATVNYVTGKNDPSASAEDLNVQSPYNTYRNAGLPPGPIASPSLSSLMAVLHPTETDYMYFLHKQPSGEAVYSKTFEEHKVNKQKFLQ